jgi:hypothetical protein
MKTRNQEVKIACTVLVLAISSVVPIVQALPPDPDNAALLYYQAFISLPKGQDQVQVQTLELADGVAPDGAVRGYLKQCQPAIDLAVAATQIQSCNWGLRYSQGFQMPMVHCAQLRVLAKLMKASAACLAADGQYRQALERGLAIRRIARHVGDQNLISFLVATALIATADKSIQDTLGTMPPDAQILAWLKGELAADPARSLEVRNSLKIEQEIILTKATADSNQLLQAITASKEGVSAEVIDQIKKGDAAFFEGSRRYFKGYMDKVAAAFDSQVPYSQKLGQLAELDKQPGLDTKQDPHSLVTVALMPGLAKLLTLETRAKSNHKLLQAAVEIYLAKAAAGTLPDQIPAAAPKDPFNGEDFKYEKTKEGFTLSRWTDKSTKDPTYRFEFRVR